MLSGLIPSQDVLDSWTDISDAAQWAGVDDGLKRAVCRRLGDANLTSLPVLAMIAPQVFELTLGECTRGDRPLHETEKACARLWHGAIRAKFGATISQSEPTSVTSKPAETGVAASSKLKLKLSQIIDQGCDLETDMLNRLELLECRRKYAISEGDSPLEREDPTDSQISCLKAKLDAGMTPFIDMGVWGPFGDRLARQMRFTAHQWNNGSWKAVELPGATSLDSWEESWRILRSTSIMLEVVSAATLDKYASEFRTRVAQHPDVWFLAAQADIRCRTEFWVQERRRQEEFHMTHPNLSAFNPAMPWTSVIRASSSHAEFWQREFEKPAMLYALQGQKMSAARPAPPPMNAAITEQPTKVPKKQFDPQRKDGRFFKSRTGTNICFAWTRSADGCSNDKCDKGFAHICEWCRQPHKSISCPQMPNWEPDAKREPKGKGKGKKRKHL